MTENRNARLCLKNVFFNGLVKQDMAGHATKAYGFNEPGSGGIWADMVELAGGRQAGDPDIYIFRPKEGLAAIAELGISQGGHNIFLPTETSGHSLLTNIWGKGSLSYYLENPDLLWQLSVQTLTQDGPIPVTDWETVESLSKTLEAATSIYGSAVQLDQVLKSGDGLSIAQSLAHYTQAQKEYAALLHTGKQPSDAGYYASSALADGLDLVQILCV